MFRNIKVFWKFAIVAILIPVAVVVTAGIGLLTSNLLKTEYDHLYLFMLVPIQNLDQANMARADLTNQLFKLTHTNATNLDLVTTRNLVLKDDKAMAAAITEYEQKYVSTGNPDFTQALVRMDKQYLQIQEANLLKQFHTIYNAYIPKRDAVLAGKSQDYATIEADLNQLRDTFTLLVTLNRQFADLSNQNAQTAIEMMRLLIVMAGLLACIAAVGITYFISRDITVPLEKVVKMIQEMGRGHLGNRLRLDRADEIGLLARTMDSFAEDLQTNVIGGLRKIAYGDLNIVVKPKDGQDEISPALQQTIESLRALNMATTFAATVAAGDIPAPISETFLGSFETLKNNLNALSDWLRQMLTGISSSTSQLSSTSAEILAATTQQASGSSEQSAAIAQTSTTVDEVKAIGEQAVMRAQEVVESANRTLEVSRSGQQTVQQMLDSMARIKERVEGIAENILALSEQTQQIDEIITTVSAIAAQSNMLALNASVEAARAGEHGKGFAVVAAEVRSLAEQSRQATAQVRAILQDIQKATNTTVMATEEGAKVVDQGVRLAGQTQVVIDQLSNVINESAQRATQVMAGGKQQTAGVEQIAVAMQNINQAMIQSLASTRQAERAAQDLNELAMHLNDLVKKYAA